ncbi:MAG TPA: oligosaccharide flippase family protein [Pseudomonas sp.]|uniref:oligosaccharide flippase family protein n=1 Tax=Pseudomonas sp. TaxID=306 RepID=UPI002BF20600|nr:oligosaccharide flippase family protein [Pseudomonas sp.]HSX88752.1 oligosaccharide flippase family protein [Pseudomonas sp.]
MQSGDLSPSSSLSRRAKSAGVWNLGALVASQGIRLGGNLIMARLLAPEMFGVMVIATTVSVVLALLSDMGLRQNIIQSKRGTDPVFLNTAWTVQILRGCVLFAVLLLLAGFAWFAQVINLSPAGSTYAAPELPLVLAVTGFTAIINGFQSTKLALAFRSFQQNKVVLIELAAQIVGLLVMLGIGYLTGSIWSLVAAGVVAAMVSTLLSHLWLQGPNNRLHWDSSAFKELIAFGRWVLLSSAVGVLGAHGDRIWFGGSMSAAELGVYSIAVLILGAIETGVHRLAAAVVLPALSEVARTGDAVRLRALYYRFRLVIDLALLLACGLLLTLSPLIIGWLYDARYSGAGSMLAVLSLSLFTLRFTVAHQAWLALGLTKYLAVNNAIRFVSLWTLLPLLLAVGGTTYAIWGVALYTLPTVFLILYINRRLGLLDIKRELVVLPMLGVGALCGMGFSHAVAWF